MPRPTDDSVQGLIQARASKMSYRWLPVQRKPDANTSLVADISRSLVEEIGFFPSKALTLTGVFLIKGKTKPGFLLWLYITLVQLILILPIFLLQGAAWQVWRACKAVFGVMTGRVTYATKQPAKNK